MTYPDPIRAVNYFTGEAPFPLPPINVFVTHPYVYGALDIRWDNPNLIAQNGKFIILGVKIYKSLDSELGPYTPLTSYPTGVLVYRDQVTHIQIDNEDVSPTLTRSTAGELYFTVRNRPMSKVTGERDGNPNLAEANTASDVIVKVDNGDGNGLQVTPVFKVNGYTGEVTLITTGIFNPTTEKLDPPRIPTGAPGSIVCTYRYQNNIVQTRLNRRIFYKVTTVGLDPSGATVETPLDNTFPVNSFGFEQVDYIWQEAIRRNRWILEQGGERVKLFIRKWMGQRCPNYSEITRDGLRDCNICFGTQIVGGYEGPFDILLAPPEAERNVDYTEAGLALKFRYSTWTGPSPVISQRDFIVKPNGERFSIGPVTPVGQRGAYFQQQFDVGYVDEGDIRYSVPVHGGEFLVPEEFDQHRQAPMLQASITEVPVPGQAPSPASPIAPLKPEGSEGTAQGKQKRGRTPVFENISY